MSPGHLVAHLYLALLGHVDLRDLHDARGELITNGEVEPLSLHLGVELLVAT